MISLFLIICLAVAVLLAVIVIKARNENVRLICGIVSILLGIASFVLLLGVFSLIDTVANGYTLDDKIAMYEEENASIEESINVTVKSYMDFEASTYGELKDKDAINLVSLFPELKSDTLVQKQIEVYIANNDKIKELKEEKIELTKSKWLLYFGK